MSTQFEFENGTAHDIKIESFSTFDQKLKKTIFLSSKGTVWTSKVFEETEPFREFDELYPVFEGDSLGIFLMVKRF